MSMNSKSLVEKVLKLRGLAFFMALGQIFWRLCVEGVYVAVVDNSCWSVVLVLCVPVQTVKLSIK